MQTVTSLGTHYDDRQSAALQGFQSQFDAMRVQEMAEMRKELKFISELIVQQATSLETLSKKRGFSS
jgi:hypothetical protein